MATSYGMLTSFDSDRQFVSTVGQDVVYAAINDLLDRHNKVVNESMAVFVDRQTDLHKMRYLLPIGGEMQTLGQQAPPGAVKRTGSYDVALPLVGIGDRLAGDRVDMGYLTAGQLESQIKSIMDRDANSVRRDLLASIFINTSRVFDDPIWGNITIQPLANNDATVFPPVIGAAAGAIDNHYLAMTPVNAVNFQTALDELMEHFGWVQGGDNVLCLCSPTDGATIGALNGFNAYADRFTNPSDAATWASSFPNAPGITTGRYLGCWINEWMWMPDNYLIFVHLDVPSPLYMREDPSDTGLGTGLKLVATNEQYPITNSFYEHRYGFGVANRLNAVVWHVTAGAYAIPAHYDFLRYSASSS